ncbi:hypothetical protein V2A60_007112 [Cordyceps javanica]
MDSLSEHEGAPHDEPAEAPTFTPDDSQSTSSQAQDEPRVVIEDQAESEILTPEDPQTPSYTFDTQAALLARPPSPIEEVDEELYADGTKRIDNNASKESSGPSCDSSPERIIESMAPRKPRPPQPIWRTTTRRCRRRSTGGMAEEIFAKRAK